VVVDMVMASKCGCGVVPTDNQPNPHHLEPYRSTSFPYTVFSRGSISKEETVQTLVEREKMVRVWVKLSKTAL
jgi:hypothetical protein